MLMPSAQRRADNQCCRCIPSCPDYKTPISGDFFDLRPRRGNSSSKSFIKVSLLFHKDHSEFELRETHTKISKTYIKT